MKQQLDKASTNFSRGLSTLATHMLNQDECSVAENFVFDQGVAEVRKGIALYGTVSAPVKGLARFYKKTGSSYFVAFAANQLYYSPSSGTFSSVSSEHIVSGPVQTAHYGDQLYYTNLSNIVRVFNGSTISDVGLSGPTYSKQIANFEADETWGSGTVDTTYAHIDKDDRALMLSTSSTTSGYIRADLSTTLNLSRFASDVSSDGQDLIKIYTVHREKTSISTIDLIVDCNDGNFSSISGDCYRCRLTDLSSWVSVSSDAWGITHTIPKDMFSSPSSGYYWSTATGIRIEMVQAGSSPAICSFDNLRMEKTPPIPVPGVPTAIVEGLVWENPLAQFGYDRYKKYTSKILKAAINIQTLQGMPSSGPTSGVYYYKNTFFRQNPDGVPIESNPSYQSSGVMVSCDPVNGLRVPITLYNVPLAPPGWGDISRNIYRRKTTESEYRLAHAVQDNYTTVFIDTVPDSALGRVLEDDHWPPPNSKFIYMAGNQRTYYYNLIEDGKLFPSRVRWSYPYEPHYVPLGNAADVASNDGTEGTGMFEFKGLLHLCKQRSVWMMDQQSSLINVHPTIGCVAPYSIAEAEDEVFWLSEQGVMMYTMTLLNISRKRNRQGDISEIIERLPKDYIKNATGIYYNGFYLLAVTDEGATENNLVLSYHIDSDTWSMFPNLNVNCWSTWTGGKDGYRLFFGNNSGQICEFFTGDTDLGLPIPSAIKTKDFGVPTPSVAWRYANIFTESLDSEDRSIKMEPYFDKETVASEAQTAGVSGIYGITKYSLPQRDGTSFCSIKLSSSGRYRIAQLDLHGKEESLR